MESVNPGLFLPGGSSTVACSERGDLQGAGAGQLQGINLSHSGTVQKPNLPIKVSVGTVHLWGEMG